MGMKAMALMTSAVSLWAVALGGCGGSSSDPAHGKNAGAAAGLGVASIHRAQAAALSAGSPSRHYLNDGDNDPYNDKDPDNLNGKTRDDDKDAYEDFIKPGNNLYHDLDDVQTVSFGMPASAADTRAVAAVVKRYYAAAVSEDAATACSMILTSLARSVVQDYGHGSAGPSYLRSGTSCQGVMALLFKHLHGQLTTAFDVTGVRVQQGQARALLGSSLMPASYVDLQMQAGVWKLTGLLAVPLA